MALANFRTKLGDIVFDEQLAGSKSFGYELTARIAELAKEELKRSVSRVFLLCYGPPPPVSLIPSTRRQPLRNTAAREGKRPRHMEGYLIGILREFLSTIVNQGKSKDRGIKHKVEFLERSERFFFPLNFDPEV